MRTDEITIDETTVRRMLAAQFPEWAGLSLRPFASGGTVNAIYRLGDDKMVRLPRFASSVPSVRQEHDLVRRLGPLLPFDVPDLLAVGEPSELYPFNWSIYRWLDGVPPLEGEASPALAEDLASFVNAFRQIDLPDGRAAYRGGPLTEQDDETRKYLAECEGLIDVPAATKAWDAALEAEPARSEGWVHADLMPGNLLAAGGRLSAVIDFETCGVGDPACDLIPAWNLLDPATRPQFREALDVDDATWLRGQGRALSMAIIQLPYYQHTNLTMAANARYVINQVLSA
ncbi:aminoglycoside phosphotransferase family protein [Kribbella sp. NBC_01245]|uniref:aminoglycoside phosphotransferase family protein n=1 Tax=Kribbella sp. NBC_01245 TaxID=2903578 RepID=UPI002E2C81E7|nr:aminoglycoside phosphotransferase family protein [Kribbella sp. NBC_01245]